MSSGPVTGRVAVSYEEKKQWIDAYNPTDTPILPFCPCLLPGLVDRTSSAAKDIGVVMVSPISKQNTELQRTDWGPWNIAINDGFTIEPKSHGRVTRDWPVFAQVHSESIFDIAVKHPFYPSTDGFRVIQPFGQADVLSLSRSHEWRLLSWPKEENSGLCLVQPVEVPAPSVVRLIGFEVVPKTANAGLDPLHVDYSDYVLDDVKSSIVELVESEFLLHAFGTYRFNVNLLCDFSMESIITTIVPSAKIVVVVEVTVEPGAVMLDNPTTGCVKTIYGVIESLMSEVGGGYGCPETLLKVSGPIELVPANLEFSIVPLEVSYSDATGLIAGFQEKKLRAKVKLLVGYSGSGFSSDPKLTGQGHVWMTTTGAYQ